MKSVPDLSRIRIACIIALSGILLAGCGQRGPLYLPAKPAPMSTAPSPQPATPASPDSTAPTSK